MVDFHSVRDSFVLPARLLTEDSVVAQGAIAAKVIHADDSLLGVIYIQTLSIGRKSKAVRLRQVLGQETNIALFIQAVHTLERGFLLLSLYQIECGIGEVNRAVGTDYHIVRAVQFLSFVTISQYGVFSVESYGDDGT